MDNFNFDWGSGLLQEGCQGEIDYGTDRSWWYCSGKQQVQEEPADAPAPEELMTPDVVIATAPPTTEVQAGKKKATGMTPELVAAKARLPKNIPCTRCGSQNTRFFDFNNYYVDQARFICKVCNKKWTLGAKERKPRARPEEVAAQKQKKLAGPSTPEKTEPKKRARKAKPDTAGPPRKRGRPAKVSTLGKQLSSTVSLGCSSSSSWA